MSPIDADRAGDDAHRGHAEDPGGPEGTRSEVAQAKQDLRDRMRDALEAMTDAERAEESESVVKHLTDLPAFREARDVLLYVSLPEEVRTHALIEACLDDPDVTVSVPRVTGSGIDAVPFTSLDELEPGTFGILEPTGRPEDPRLLDLAVLPGRAFDADGGRLGRGTGHFDRFLNEFDPPAVGLAYRLQVVETVPTGPYDHPVDAVVTADGVHGTARLPEP